MNSLADGLPPEIARQIKARIRLHTDTDLIASVGVAPNKFLAKLASDVGKPDGFVVLRVSGRIDSTYVATMRESMEKEKTTKRGLGD